MVWKCVHGVAPAYLSDLCVPATAISDRQHLRSAATGTLLVPRARTATGQRSFAVNRPATWNRLPPALRLPHLSESAFKRALKTHLFSTARRHWDVFMILAPDINIQTYLYLLTYYKSSYDDDDDELPILSYCCNVTNNKEANTMNVWKTHHYTSDRGGQPTANSKSLVGSMVRVLMGYLKRWVFRRRLKVSKVCESVMLRRSPAKWLLVNDRFQTQHIFI